MARRPNWRRVRSKWPYTVDEIAQTLGVHKATVRRWINLKGLSPIDTTKPTLVLGQVLIDFLRGGSTPKAKARFDEAFCFSCRDRRRAGGRMAEVTSESNGSINVLMLCDTCGGAMFKRFSQRKLPMLAAKFDLTIPQALSHLNHLTRPCLNVHVETGGSDHGKVQRQE